jgi:hypothetical protein
MFPACSNSYRLAPAIDLRVWREWSKDSVPRADTAGPNLAADLGRMNGPLGVVSSQCRREPAKSIPLGRWRSPVPESCLENPKVHGAEIYNCSMLLATLVFRVLACMVAA